jgi:hypothetical protein
MTFDELWRLNLVETDKVKYPARRDAPTLSPDDPDEAEVNRFLDWLEQTVGETNH